MAGKFDFDRFVNAQDRTYDIALAELKRGAKRHHWIWYIFPHVADSGTSVMAQRCAIGSLEEARAYLDHPLLAARYRECVATLQDLTNDRRGYLWWHRRDKAAVVADLVRRSQRLAVVKAALDGWFGDRDHATLAILETALPLAQPERIDR